MNELFFLFSSIHPQSGQVASLYSPLPLYVVEIKFILRNRHRQRVETMQLCWDSLKKKPVLIILLATSRLFSLSSYFFFFYDTLTRSPSTCWNDLRLKDIVNMKHLPLQ
jgi:hypothetical protein